MKRLLFGLMIFLFSLTNAQQFFVTTGVSATNSSNFMNTTQYHLEGGFELNDVSYSVLAGSIDLHYKTFWYEAKVKYSFDVLDVRPYVLTGIGSYFHNDKMFIEYGAGISSQFETVSPFLQVTNRDKINYLTLGLKFDL